MKSIKDRFLVLFGHGRGCDRALTMAHLFHEHAKVHYATCDKCKLVVDTLDPEYAAKVQDPTDG